VVQYLVAKKYDEKRNSNGKGPHYLGPFGYYYHHVPEFFVFLFVGPVLWGLSILNLSPLLVPLLILVIEGWNLSLLFFPRLANRVMKMLRLYKEKGYVPDPLGAKISTFLLLLVALGLGYWFGMQLF
jgi:hypothetical protein